MSTPSSARKASRTWDPQRAANKNSNTMEKVPRKPNKEKASTWSFEKMSTTTDVPVRISIEKVIDIEWLGRHTQLIPDQQTYEELVIDVAKEFHIDLDFMAAMCLELSFKSLAPNGKQRRVNADNFATEYKKVRQLVVTVVDQSEKEVDKATRDREKEEKKEKSEKDKEPRDRDRDRDRDRHHHHHAATNTNGTDEPKQPSDRETL